MPGRRWYAIALLVVLAGAAGAGVFAYTRLSGLTRELPQVIVPGEADLTLSRAGTYTIYLEREAVVNGRLYSTGDDIAGLQVRVTSPTGDAMEMANPSMSSTYSIGGRSGEAVLAFTVTEPGQYRLAAAYPDLRAGPQGVLAIGLGVATKILTTMLLAMGMGFLAFVIGAVVTAVTFFKRRNARRRGAVGAAVGAVIS